MAWTMITTLTLTDQVQAVPCSHDKQAVQTTYQLTPKPIYLLRNVTAYITKLPDMP